MQSVHPDDAELCFQTFARAFNTRQPLEMEYRLRRHDGQYGWVRDFGKPAYDIEGNFIGYLNACHDISASKQSQLQLERSRKRLRALSAHLQTAREEEKMKIARELHDEFGAKLTALKLDLGWLTSKLPPEPSVREKAAAMSDALDTALNGMRRMWSELRPSVLDDLGLVAALKWEAREFRRLWRIPVTVRAEDEAVPPPIALALYRIMQEALANVAVHAKASQVVITFRSAPEAWTLEIRDDGVGVDERRILAEDRAGYGLSAMYERAHALNGVVSVKAAPVRGTLVTAVIPRPVPKQAA
jgi:two-component system sensor histidine kinase UhpB